MPKKSKTLPAISPGEIIIFEMIVPQLAMDLDLSEEVVAGIVAGTHKITASLANKLSKHFNTSAGLWIALQLQYDAETAMLKKQAEEIVSTIGSVLKKKKKTK